jgi:hypothetical protein
MPLIARLPENISMGKKGTVFWLGFFVPRQIAEGFVDKPGIIHRYPQQFTKRKRSKKKNNVNTAAATSSLRVKTSTSKSTTGESVTAVNWGV